MRISYDTYVTIIRLKDEKITTRDITYASQRVRIKIEQLIEELERNSIYEAHGWRIEFRRISDFTE
jgi:hypothetical protein